VLTVQIRKRNDRELQPFGPVNAQYADGVDLIVPKDSLALFIALAKSTTVLP
jgi:hypothetical protein